MSKRLLMGCVRVAVVATLVWFASSLPADAQDGFDPNGQCVGDQDGNGQVTIDEILTSVNNALHGCDFMPVTLQFRATVGTDSFACGNTYHGVGTKAADIEPADFRFYIHNIRLVTADGREVPMRLDQDHAWQLDNLVLLDFENRVPPCNDGTPQTNTVVHGKIAPGEYTGVRFTLGVPFERNHADASVAPPPLGFTGLFWGWQDGYKFLRFDTKLEKFTVHVGSTGCEPGPTVVVSCARPNLAEVNLSGFDPASSVIVADLAALLADTDIDPSANQPGSAPGCQSEPDDHDCDPIFKNLGINFSDGSPNPASQKFFRIE